MALFSWVCVSSCASHLVALKARPNSVNSPFGVCGTSSRDKSTVCGPGLDRANRTKSTNFLRYALLCAPHALHQLAAVGDQRVLAKARVGCRQRKRSHG